MNEHIDVWLDAYLDGELPAVQSRQVEAHLDDCPACRQRLEQRRGLSLLLAGAPGANDLKPEGRFVAEVELQLRRRGPAVPPKIRATRLGWALFPVGLLLAAVFVQAVLILSTAVEWIPGARQALAAPESLLSVIPALPEPASGVLGLVRLVELPSVSWISLTVILAMIAVLYVGWLATWWARNRQADSRSDNAV